MVSCWNFESPLSVRWELILTSLQETCARVWERFANDQMPSAKRKNLSELDLTHQLSNIYFLRWEDWERTIVQCVCYHWSFVLALIWVEKFAQFEEFIYHVITRHWECLACSAFCFSSWRKLNFIKRKFQDILTSLSQAANLAIESMIYREGFVVCRMQ